MENKNVMVSIICNVYNHEKYIRNTLDGFVHQITNFPIEVLLHDDCSTDNSAAIIREYEKKYPDIIKAIYQKENQYSKGVGITLTYQVPRVIGKYIAFCEGDDRWIDPYKLQKQVDYLEANPECSFCFTNAIMMNVQNGKERLQIPYNKEERHYLKPSNNYSLQDLSKLAFIPTCSFVYPSKNYELFPDYFHEHCFGGDRRLALYSAALGYAHFIDEPTCCYNYGVSGSLMTRNKSKKEFADIEMSYVNLNNRLNQFTNNQYKETLDADTMSRLKFVYYLLGKGASFSKDTWEALYDSLTWKDRIISFLMRNMPDGLFNLLRNVKRKLFV